MARMILPLATRSRKGVSSPGGRKTQGRVENEGIVAREGCVVNGKEPQRVVVMLQSCGKRA